MAKGRAEMGDRKVPAAAVPANDPPAASITGKPATYKFPATLGTDKMSDYVEFSFFDVVGDGVPEKDANGNPTNVATKKRDELTQEYSSQANIKTTVESTKSAIVSGINLADRGMTAIMDAARWMGIADPVKEGEQAKAGWFQITAAAVNKIGSKAQYKFTGQIVRLMMPTKVMINDGANWQAFNSAPSMWGQLVNFFAGDRKVDQLVHEASKLITGTLYEDGDKMAEAMQAKTYNYYPGQAFQGMSRRQFRFDWTFVPKNMDEYNQIRGIVNVFRYNAHPSVDGLFLYYPSQVDVDFMSMIRNKADRNQHIPRIASCVIKDVSVDYTPNNQWIAIDNPSLNGAPHQITFSVTIEEVSSLVKTDISKGY